MPRPVSNPPNPWSSTHVDWLGDPPPAELEVFEEDAKEILAENDSPDVGFRWSVNPYRGCYHGCAYCYARPSHQYLGYGAGTDFERKIVVKPNAPELLRAAFERRSWQGELVAFSGNTDCYQPLEASYRLTRRLLEVCVEYRNAASVITKGALVRRDVDVLAQLCKVTNVHATMSIAFKDDETSRRIEPWASKPSARFEALRILSDAGVSTGIGIAPVIPGLNDEDIPELLERAHAAGARRAFLVALRLPAEVRPVFEERVADVLPVERVRKITHAVQEMRGGHMNEARFGKRMVGVGARWATIEAMFEAQCRRLGMNAGERVGQDGESPSTFRRPTGQLTLL